MSSGRCVSSCSQCWTFAADLQFAFSEKLKLHVEQIPKNCADWTVLVITWSGARCSERAQSHGDRCGFAHKFEHFDEEAGGVTWVD